MLVHVFGNPELAQDALPLRILPELKRRRPDVEFVVRDPNEELEVEGEVVVIDTVVGVAEPRIFDGLDAFAAAPRLTAHDFDAYAALRLLQKLGRVTKIKIIGLPAETTPTTAVEFVASCLHSSG